jgi:hypothetical protein
MKAMSKYLSHSQDSFWAGWFHAQNQIHPIELTNKEIADIFPGVNTDAFSNAMQDFFLSDFYRFNLINTIPWQ